MTSKSATQLPRYVAEWLDENMCDFEDVYSLLDAIMNSPEEKVMQYANGNINRVARAYLGGYVSERALYSIRVSKEEGVYIAIDDSGKLTLMDREAVIRGFGLFTEEELEKIDPEISLLAKEMALFNHDKPSKVWKFREGAVDEQTKRDRELGLVGMFER